MKQRMTANQKIDHLVGLVIVLSLIIVFLIFKLIHWNIFDYGFVFLFIGFNLPFLIRQRRQYQKIGELKEILNIPIEELRKISGAGKYDLTAWEKKKMYLSSRQFYLLEEYLENQYLIKFGEKYQRPSAKHLQNRQKAIHLDKK